MLLELAASPLGGVTRLLHAARDGDAGAMDRIMSLVYDDRRLLANRQLRRGFGPNTMHPTSPVHEAYMKLARGGALHAGDRAHFFAIAARAMRQVLVDDARRRLGGKRGGELATALGITERTVRRDWVKARGWL